MSWQLIEPYVSALLYFIAGGLLLLFIYGRVILQIQDGFRKFIAVRLVLLLCTVPFAVFGYWRGIDMWIVVPLLVLAAAVFIEAQRYVLKIRYRADAPVEVVSSGFSVFRPLTTTSLAVRRYEIKVPRWKSGRLRIAHISDLHAHNTLDAGYFHSVTERILSYKPDAVFITGDFVSRIQYADRIPVFLSGLKARLGVYASLGNHDYWTDILRIGVELERAGVVVLSNRAVALDAGGGDSLLVSGCDDPWSAEVWCPPEKAQNIPLAVLSHTADNIYKLSRQGAWAVFSGHFHAGQAKLPWYGPIIIPSRHGRIFDHGHFKVNDTHLFVTAGIGAAFPSFRIYCEPEVIIVDCVAEDGG